MKVRILFFGITILPSVFLLGNNPRKYFELTNKAELAICDSLYTEAAQYYTEAFQYVEEPFGRDIYNLFVCGLMNKDSAALQLCADKFIERNYNTMSDTFLSYFPDEISSYWRYLTQTSTQRMSLDTSFVTLIEELLVLDQVPRRYSTDYEKMRIADSLHIRKMQNYMEEHRVFISEKHIGNRLDYANMPLRIEMVLIHYAGGASGENKKKDLINLNLKQKVLNGEFDPKLYAHLYDVRGYTFDGKLANNKKGYGTDWFFYPYSKAEGLKMSKPPFSKRKIQKMNKRREEIYLEPYEDALKKQAYYYNLIKHNTSPILYPRSDFFFEITTGVYHMVMINKNSQ